MQSLSASPPSTSGNNNKIIMESFKEKALRVIRWIFFIPGAVACSYVIYMLFYTLNKANPYTKIDGLWDMLLIFAGHVLMGGAFVFIGAMIAPSWKKTCSVVLFGIACAFVGICVFANFLTSFTWVPFICALCLLGGAGAGLYMVLDEFKDEADEKA